MFLDMAELDITAAIESYVAAARRQTSDATDIQTAKVTDVTNFNSTGKVTATIHGGTETIQVHCALAEEVNVGDFILVRPGRGLTSEWFAVGFNQSAAGSAIPVIRNASLPDHTHVSGSGQGGVLDTYARQADDEEITGTWTHRITDAVTNTVTRIINWAHQTTGTAAAGFGLGHLFKLENAAGTEENAAATDVVWEDAGSGTEDSAIVDYIRVDGAALSEARRVNEKGVLLPSGRDLFPNVYTNALPGRGLASRLINPVGLTTTTCHFRCGAAAGAGHLAAYSWDTAAPFGGVPGYLYYSYAGDYLLFTDTAAPWEKHYLRRTITNAAASWQGKSIYARVRVGLNHWGGIRLDDGTDDNYVEFMVDASSVAAGSRVVFRYRDNGGAVNTVNSAFNTPNTHYYIVRIRCYYSAPNYTAYTYLIAEDGSVLNFQSHSLMGWTTPPPVAGRVGLLCDPTVAGAAGNPVSFDWFYCDFT